MARQTTDETPACWLYVISWEPSAVGGVNQVVTNLFDRTRAVLGYEPLLLVRSWKHRNAQCTVVERRRTVHARVTSPWLETSPTRNALAFVVGLPALLMRLKALLVRERVAVVNVHFADLSALVWILLRDWLRLPIRVVLAFHGRDLRSAAAAQSGPQGLWRWMLNAADGNVVCSADLAQLMRAQWSVPEEKIMIIGNGVDVKGVREAASRVPNRPLPGRYIISLGTFERKKGHDLLLAAFERIATDHRDVSLMLAGRIGEADTWEHLQRTRSASAVADRILLLTSVQHIEAMQLLARAEIFALASRQEPFGIAILEAGALKKPVVATEACGAAREFAQGTEIIRIPGEDVDRLAQALHRLLCDREGATRLGDALERKVVERFDWDTVAQQWRAVAARPVRQGRKGLRTSSAH